MPLRPALFALAFGAAVLARADDFTQTAFTSMGPIDQFATGWGLFVSKSAPGYDDQNIAAQFTSATSGTVAKIFLPAFYMEGIGKLKVSLHNDAADVVGAEIESWTLEVNSSSPGLYSLDGDGDTPLESDKNYWLQLEAVPGSVVAWNMSDDIWANSSWRKVGLVHGENDGSNFTVSSILPGFRIETAPKVETVPEPATLAVTTLALVVLGRRRTRIA